MKFEKIVSVDNTGLIEEVKEKLLSLGKEVVFYNDYPKSNYEIIERIKDADCVLVSWNTPIDKDVIDNCESLKYIGMCCSLYDEKSSNVDIAASRENGIKVFGVRDYGDEGVIEFILSQLIILLHGFGEHQWKSEELELTNQRLGIIGLGTLGSMLAMAANNMGMDVSYFNRTRKPELEAIGVKFLEIKPLLESVDIVSTHLPRNTIIIDEENFERLGNGKILVNTSLEPTFDVQAFANWIIRDGNYGIFDRVAMGAYYEELKKHRNVIYTDKVAGWTTQAKERLSYKVINNIERYFKESI
ncbi:NAD(P)-dependent oxidoreductase [Tissierella sp. Yu-01]|uniref:NAD(P)-dependent oxidoreductase n=1 Tax=Tissierella sp. Yu-01 TaxID=3035694 RepID=UPI00240E9A11|nr:NAD(P)-dependent oxidoreductase [Tissierella sp. Yu-01]WFA07815.1 NAD(P)-dependent oxidoreductase [Tissierella sp. Yu-01]